MTERKPMDLTPAQEAKKRELESRRDGPCPKSPHGTHGDPDNSGLCIYCACIIDITPRDYFFE